MKTILTEPYILSKDAIRDYQRDGFVRLSQVLPRAEVACFRKEILDLVARKNTETRALKDRDTYGKAFLQIFNLWKDSEAIRQFVLSSRFGNIAAQLMGVEKVRIYHDQALFKEAGGGHTPWHRDQFYWPLDTDKTITMWMPLVDIMKEMGIMQFIAGSHHEADLFSKEISDASEEFFAKYIEEHSVPVSGAVFMQAGDASFHSGLTLHNAPPNETGTMREVMTIIYYADNTRISEPNSDYQQNDLKAWLGGKKPGELADSEMNPLVKG